MGHKKRNAIVWLPGALSKHPTEWSATKVKFINIVELMRVHTSAELLHNKMAIFLTYGQLKNSHFVKNC